MLRVGLTGALGSGKSTVAGFLKDLGAYVIEADAIGRALMEPGQPVYRAIVDAFGPAVVLPSGALDRARLARLAFTEGRLGELNGIVHPPVVAAQEAWAKELFAREPGAVAVVESALIFEASKSSGEGTGHGTVPGWRQRFDKVVLVTAPEELKVARYVNRLLPLQDLTEAERAERAAALREDALRRLRAQIPDEEKLPMCDYVLRNDASFEQLRQKTEHVYRELQELSLRRAAQAHGSGSGD